MLRDVTDVIRSTYFYLVALFIIAVLLLKLGFLPSWRINFLFFAIVIGFFGSTLRNKKNTVQFPVWLVWVAVGMAILVRTIPYWHNSVPLGYDPGIHAYSFTHPFADAWTDSAFPLPFLLLMAGLTAVFGTWFVLVPLFIIISASTAYVLYAVVRRRFDREAGIIAALLFAVSITQFETFWYNYYKNVLGIIALLVALMHVPNNKHLNWKLIAAGIVVGGTHQPALFIFGITYTLYVLLDIQLINRKVFWNEMLNGVCIVAGIAVTNYDRVSTLYVPQLLASANALIALEGGSGTFFDAHTYFFYAIMIVPFAITGFTYYWKKNIAFSLAALVTTLVVLLQLFFHNRFIIYLAVFVLIYAALGFIVLLENNKTYGLVVLWSVLALSVALLVMHAYESKPLVSEQELADIERLNAIEANATVMSTDRYYSSWLKGYVDRPVIAPGLFDENKMNKDEWIKFWNAESREQYLDLYAKPVYIFVGQRQPQYNFSEICPSQRYDTATVYRCA